MDYFEATSRYPEAGRIRLAPESWTVPVMDYLETRWPLVLLLGLVGGGLTAFGRRRRRRTAERVAKLESLAKDSVGHDPLLQTVLDGHRLTRVLGRGASATVYLAVPDETLDQSKAVAIKVFSDETVRSEEFLTRFRREAKLYQSLLHPGIVQMIDWGQQGHLFYLVMEYVKGEPIQGSLVNSPQMERDALTLLRQIAASLGHAHDGGVIHRDVKPSNVLVTAEGRTKLLDFGLAREVISSLTKTGHALGTPLYMAPEQISGVLVDHRCDQYALGVLAYELMSGQKTFETEENDAAPILFQQVNNDPAPLRERGVEVSQATEVLIETLMCREPVGRFPNMKEVEKAISQALEGLQKEVQ